MKNGYNGMDNGKLISNFVEEDNSFFITFLDGSYYKVPISKENKTTILEVMLNQAEDRKKSNALKDSKTKRAKFMLGMCAGAITSAAMLVMSQNNDNTAHQTLTTILAGVSGIGFLISGIQYHLEKGVIEELQKYAVYLRIKDRMEECKDSNLFNGVPEKASFLNINTLDNYSLRDLKTIEGNLGRCEMLYPKFDRHHASNR